MGWAGSGGPVIGFHIRVGPIVQKTQPIRVTLLPALLLTNLVGSGEVQTYSPISDKSSNIVIQSTLDFFDCSVKPGEIIGPTLSTFSEKVFNITQGRPDLRGETEG